MSKQYGVVLIGCGYIGEEHLAQIHYRENVRILAVVDVNEEAAKQLAAKYHICEYATDYHKYLDMPEMDIAIIATNVDTHLEIMHACVNAGKHVVCEKPVANSLEKGCAFFDIAQQAQNNGIHVLVGHILRYNRSYQKMKELIDAGTIGKITMFRFAQNHHALNWKRYQRLLQDCPPILDCGVHYFDVMQWFTNEKIVRATGHGSRLDADSPCDNHYMASLVLSGGCCGSYESGWSKNLCATNCKEIIGERGYIRFTLQADRLRDREEGDLIEVYHSDTNNYEIINQPSVYKDMNAQLQELIARIEGRGSVDFTLQNAKEAFMAAIEIIESSKSC